MIRAALKYLVELGRENGNIPIEVDGRLYWSRTGKPIKPPLTDAVTTTGSIDAFLSVLDSPELQDLNIGVVEIVVEGTDRVSMVVRPSLLWRERHTIIEARWGCEEFPFNQYLPVEDFVIKAQCRFQDTEEKRTLIEHVSGIIAEESIETQDDGVTQAVIRKDSMNRKNREYITPIINLRPYRTFPEVVQTESPFLLRMSKSNDAPTVALFEADGGMWIADACSNIAEYIRNDKRVKRHEIAVIG